MTRREALKTLEMAVEELQFMYANHHRENVKKAQQDEDNKTIEEAWLAIHTLRKYYNILNCEKDEDDQDKGIFF